MVLTIFEPFQRTEQSGPPYSVSLRCFFRHTENGVKTSLLCLQTQAAVEAALQAAQLPTIYQLTKAYGRHAFDPSAGKTVKEWAEQRSRLYSQWRRGESPMRKVGGRLNRAAADFIDSLDPLVAAVVLAVFDWPLWRLLDPQPIPIDLLHRLLSRRLINLNWPSVYLAEAWSPPAIAKYGKQMAELLSDPGARLEAIEGLWLAMRMARHVDELPLYALCYGIWLKAEPVLQADPILGRLSAGLYAHAESHFAQLRLVPSDAESLSEAYGVLWDTGMPLAVEGGDPRRGVVVDAALTWMLCDDSPMGDARRPPLRVRPLTPRELVSRTPRRST